MGNAAVRRLLVRSAPPVVGLVVLTLAAAGCSWIQPSNQSLAGPASSAGPSQPSASVTAAPPQLDVTRAERQSADARTISASFRERISGATAVTLSGQVRVQRTPFRIAEQLTMTVGGHTAELNAIVTGAASYVQAPQTSASWIKEPVPNAERKALLAELSNADPTAQTRLILAASHARFAGRQSVEGVVTSRYVGSVAPEVALAAVPSALRARLAPAVSLITGDIHYTLWVEAGNRVKQFRVAERTLSSKITVTETIDWINRPLHIAVPRLSEVPTSSNGVVTSG
jgi:hypothetical protein